MCFQSIFLTPKAQNSSNLCFQLYLTIKSLPASLTSAFKGLRVKNFLCGRIDMMYGEDMPPPPARGCLFAEQAGVFGIHHVNLLRMQKA